MGKVSLFFFLAVIPAKAGIHWLLFFAQQPKIKMDPGLRRDDG